MTFAGCGSQEQDEFNAHQQVQSSKDAVPSVSDLIPWKPMTTDNLQASADSGRWVLIDAEQLTIFQIQRGEQDYRRSTKIRDLIKSENVDCYYFLGEMNADSDGSATLDFLNSLLGEIELFDDDAFGYLINFKKGNNYPIKKGTADELVPILQLIKKKQKDR